MSDQKNCPIIRGTKWASLCLKFPRNLVIIEFFLCIFN